MYTMSASQPFPNWESIMSLNFAVNYEEHISFVSYILKNFKTPFCVHVNLCMETEEIKQTFCILVIGLFCIVG